MTTQSHLAPMLEMNRARPLLLLYAYMIRYLLNKKAAGAGIEHATLWIIYVNRMYARTYELSWYANTIPDSLGCRHMEATTDRSWRSADSATPLGPLDISCGVTSSNSFTVLMDTWRRSSCSAAFASRDLTRHYTVTRNTWTAFYSSHALLHGAGSFLRR